MVSNRTGEYNFLGQRDRSSFIVPGQRDNGLSSKSCHGPGKTRTACQIPGRDAGLNNLYFSVLGFLQWDKEIFLSQEKGTIGHPVPDCPGISRFATHAALTGLIGVGYALVSLFLL